MGLLAKLNGYHLEQFLRVSPDEGFDPASGQSLRAPQFGEAVSGEGDPLISITDHNREISLPLHLQSSKPRYKHTILGDQPSLYWRMGTGGFSDISGSGRDGTANGGVTAGGSPGALNGDGDTSTDFDGSNDYVTSTYDPVSSGAIRSYEAWVKRDTTATNQGVFDFNGSYFWILSGGAGSNGQWSVDGAETKTITGLGKAAGEYAHYVLVVNDTAKTYTVYKDGALLDSGTFTNAVTGTRFSVANVSNGNILDGKMDEVAVYEYALSASQVLEHYNAGIDGYAATKDGLHELVQQINRACAEGGTLAWRDEGATEVTYLDVLAARWEPDYNFRRAQRMWQSGVLRIWTKPYGHTGTSRIVGTAAGTGIAVPVTLGSVIGDTSAEVEVRIQVGSQNIRDGRIVGAAVVPTGYIYDWAAASFNRLDGASLVAAPNVAAGSQVVQQVSSGYQRDIGQIVFSPASAYLGRNRVFAVAHHSRFGAAKLRAYDQGGNPLSQNGAFASSFPSMGGFNTVDLGVLTVDDPLPATLALRITSEVVEDALRFSGGTGMHTCVNRLLILPEDTLNLIVDTSREPLSYDNYDKETLSLDYYGNQYLQATQLATRYLDPIGVSDIWGGRLMPYDANDGSESIAVMRLGHYPYADIEVEAAGDSGIVGMPSYGYGVGKVCFISSAVHGLWGRVMLQANGSRSMQILAGQSAITPSVLASVSISTGVDVVRFRTNGPVIKVEGYDMLGNYMATLSASIAIAAATGYTGLAAWAGTGYDSAADDRPYLTGHRSARIPSIGVAPRDIYQMAPSGARRWTSASVAGPRLDGTTRGGFISPRAQPNRSSDSVVAIHLPLDTAETSGLISAEVRVRERFSYGR